MAESSTLGDQQELFLPVDGRTAASGRWCERFEYPKDGKNKMKKAMQSRHLMMIAMGGTVGNGIFLSSGYAISIAGPGSALLSYILVGIFMYAVMISLGEMAAMYPVPGAFSAFGARFVSPAFGFTLGWNYWFLASLSISTELTAAVVILQYWAPQSRPWHWAIFVFFPVFALQFIQVRFYGESEYWFSSVKVLMIVLFIIVGLIYDWGGIKDHPGPGLSNFRGGEAFIGGSLAFIQILIYTFYSYSGMEVVSIAAGEAINPDVTVERATKATTYRIILFYILTILTIGLCISSTDPILSTTNYNSQVSPLTVVIERAGFRAAVHLINAVLFTSVISATNTWFYACSRILLSLARSGQAPRIFGWVTSNGIPVPALLIALVVSVLASMTTVWSNGIVFTWLLILTGNSALLAWASIGFTSLRFRWAYKAQGRDLSDLPFKQYWFPVLPYCILALVAGLLIAEGYAAVIQKPFEVKNIIGTYIGVIPYVVLYIGYIVYERFTLKPEMRPRFLVPLLEVDLDSDAVWEPGEGKGRRESRKREVTQTGGRIKRYWKYFLRYIY